MKLSLSALRVNQGFTIKEAAKKLQVGESTLWKWENGKSEPSVRSINAILSLYGVCYEDIFLSKKND